MHRTRHPLQESDDDEDETYNDVVPESPSSCEDSKISKPNPKKSRRNVEKRVVSVPIGDVEGSKSRGEVYPPSDSWAWRKYGQKPIKGSPYPRGYYRCSSSKGCPARKQVEKSRMDPTKLLITYASDHNHPFPSSSSSSTNPKSHHHRTTTTTTTTIFKPPKKQESDEEQQPTTIITPPPTTTIEEPVGLDLSHVDSPLLLGGASCYSEFGELGWFYDAAISSSSSSSSNSTANFLDVTLERGFGINGEEDESLFGDLGDLPDCASVFRRRTVAKEEQQHHRRCDFGAIPFCDSSR